MAAREERERPVTDGRGNVNKHGYTCLTKQSVFRCKLAGLCVLKSEERGTEKKEREPHLSEFA